MAWRIVKFQENDYAGLMQVARQAADALEKGCLVIHPTDTCYGFAADFKNKKAINDIFRLKGREHSKPFFINVRNVHQFRTYGPYSQLIKKIVATYPGLPFTFVVKRKKTVPAFLNPALPTIGIRIPRSRFFQILLRNFGRPIVGTSANIAGKDPCYSVAEIRQQFKRKIDRPVLVVDGGPLARIKPSTVVAITGKNSFKILRAGNIKDISIK